MSIVDGVTLTTIDGELQPLAPLEICEADEVDATNSDLCDEPSQLTEAALIANAWLMQNLFLDSLLGYEGPVFGVIVVEDGVVTSFTPLTPPVDDPPATPVVPDPSITIDDNTSGEQDPGPADEIITDASSPVFFTINTGGAQYIFFTDLFDDDPNEAESEALEISAPFGTLRWSTDEGYTWDLVAVGAQYLSTTLFEFEPSSPYYYVDSDGVDGAGFYGGDQTGDFSFYVQTASGQQSEVETVNVTVLDDCGYSFGSTEAAEPADTPPPAAEDTTASSTPAPETTEEPPADPAE